MDADEGVANRGQARKEIALSVSRFYFLADDDYDLSDWARDIIGKPIPYPPHWSSARTCQLSPAALGVRCEE